MLGIIGGTGVSSILRRGKEEVINTPYGKARVLLDRENEVVLLFRHGLKHTIPPHRINYRANIYALKMLGVERILSINTVGSLKEYIEPGRFFIPQDFIEFTKSRPSTYYDGENNKVMHIDLSEPYCPEVVSILRDILDRRGYPYSEGVYICTEGPRFETKAEIKFYRSLGDVVGMTGYPEVALARELGLCYSSLCTVTNYAAGISKDRLTVDEVFDVVKKMEEKLVNTVEDFIEHPHTREKSCQCAEIPKYCTVK
ncbi:MAG TPA: S-methyl-5'-thioinosine phosphorylase [Methanothermococcus okinawensis]|uniref:Probable S-methyl-5'-thioinosine phosphorylase n=1 Tax=Methanothermococcus okinawensis TaxID=155863 RepID=A0A832Z846_9EURY|nr:S-methyl-5'-thioinosine phosphorylase [Methanothermococcus okinawensis]